MEWILYLSLALYQGILLFLFIGWYKLRHPITTAQNYPPFSVLIAARNEARNLEQNLPHVLRQSYPNFEILVILDRCTDDSERVIQQLALRHPQLRMLSIAETPKDWAPKKYALDQGIRISQYELFAFTDADCRPEPNWLAGIAGKMEEGADLVLGISPYQQKEGLLNSFIRFETFFTLFQYIGFANMRMPYMGVGRNIAYRKNHFHAHHGLETVKQSLSGDDDLLVNHFANPDRTAVMLAKGTRVESDPETTWRAWMLQKMRHISASAKYKPLSQLILATFHGAHAIFYVSLIVVTFADFQWATICALWAAKWIPSALLLGILDRKWKIGGISLLFPVHDFLFCCYHLLLVPAGLLANPKWR